jgi:glycosyltransferase involved in cell wall biosynthesis
LKNKFYVISCQRNAGGHALKCLDSVKKQTLKVEKHLYVDDASDDVTLQLIKGWSCNNKTSNVEIIESESRLHKTHWLYTLITGINDDDGIVVIVDGDDWLHTPLALEIISEQYDKNPKLEYVYSNWMYSHNKELGISKPITSNAWDPYRNEWITSHLTTFKVKSYKRIPVSNFKDADGKFFVTANDQACNLALLASLKMRDGGYEAVKHLNLPLYVYQYAESDAAIRKGDSGKEYMSKQYETAQFIRRRGFLKE